MTRSFAWEGRRKKGLPDSENTPVWGVNHQAANMRVKGPPTGELSHREEERQELRPLTGKEITRL